MRCEIPGVFVRLCEFLEGYGSFRKFAGDFVRFREISDREDGKMCNVGLQGLHYAYSYSLRSTASMEPGQ